MDLPLLVAPVGPDHDGRRAVVTGVLQVISAAPLARSDAKAGSMDSVVAC